jgi:hypothetical protein
VPRKTARKSKIKSCIILNPPRTLDEQEELERRAAKALAQALYLALSPEELDALIRHLETEIKSERRDAS